MKERFRVTGWTDTIGHTQILVDGRHDDNIDVDRDALRHVIVAEIRRRGYRFNGVYHQQGEFGRPIINDKYVVMYSQRSWGGIIAEALQIDNSDGMAYCDWAWGNPHGEYPVYPRPKDYGRMF